MRAAWGLPVRRDTRQASEPGAPRFTPAMPCRIPGTLVTGLHDTLQTRSPPVSAALGDLFECVSAHQLPPQLQAQGDLNL